MNTKTSNKLHFPLIRKKKILQKGNSPFQDIYSQRNSRICAIHFEQK